MIDERAASLVDDSVRSQLAQPRAHVARRYAKTVRNVSRREPVRRAPQHLDNALPKIGFHRSPRHGAIIRAIGRLPQVRMVVNPGDGDAVCVTCCRFTKGDSAASPI